ncbi:MAG: OmpA family protein [Phaeodactylibacter sp.]|nr:OmpA family protein [Phaeodactylibacter sp.]MCB9290982.1 OmpA family protein [Lewinellaceae bacterium]
MTKSNTLLLAVALFLGVMGSLQAQKQKNSSFATPKDMFEVGVGGGYLFVSGDVTQQPGFGGSFHVRKSIDYLFSLRVDGMYGKASGENNDINNYAAFETSLFSGTIFGVISANSMRWNQSVRKFNLYGMAGVGATQFKADTRQDDKRPFGKGKAQTMPHFTGGAGVSFRLSPRVNVGIEHQAHIGFGNQSDLVDGFNFGSGPTSRSLFRDVINYTAVQINVNIGNTSTHSEPLYWVNPLDAVMNDLSKIKDQQQLALEDSDADGVIDAIDQEPNTPPDVPVDTKGRTLDSDRDGVPDYKDREPYFPPRPGERVNEEGVVVNPVAGPGGGVSESRVREIIAEELQNYQLRDEGSASGGSVTEWFLPMIHFGISSSTVKYSDYGTLASIARMMKGNPNIRLVVSGHTDSTGEVPSNNVLSYNRAKAVIDHLVNNHGIGRGRLVLEWKGQDQLLVPSGSSYMNRRVEFRVAQPDDVEMDPPAGVSKSSGDGY